MTDSIRVVSQSPGEISVLCPPDNTNAFFLYFGMIAIVIGGIIYYKQRNWSISSWVLMTGLFALVLGAWSLTSVTTIDASANTGELVVRYSVAGIPVNRHVYRLAEVEGFRIGFIRGTRYIYAQLAGGGAPQISPASYRNGYEQAADALNDFLGSVNPGNPSQ